MYSVIIMLASHCPEVDTRWKHDDINFQTCRRNLVLTDLLAFAIDFWMLPRYIPEHFGIFPKFNDGRR